MANVTKINYKNNEYSLDGVSLEQALELLHIDKDSVTMETEGDTLYIMAKAGSKGAISLADMKAEEEEKAISLAAMVEPTRKSVELINGELVEVSTRKAVELVDGELVEIEIEFCEEEDEDIKCYCIECGLDTLEMLLISASTKLMIDPDGALVDIEKALQVIDKIEADTF